MGKKQEHFGPQVRKYIFFKKCLDRLNIGRNYIGYYYIVEILDLLINKEMEAKMFSTEIYPVVARIFSVKECTIERNIRHLIDSCWNKNMVEKLKYQVEFDKPTCCKFVKLVEDYVKREIN